MSSVLVYFFFFPKCFLYLPELTVFLFQKKKKKSKTTKTYRARQLLQMSDSRVSSVIQEWASAYPGQAQSLNPVTCSQAGSTGQLAQMDMIPYSQSQGMMRGAADDRVAEQMMGLSYLPYSTSCVSNNSNAGSTNHHQSHGSSQQVMLFMCDNSSKCHLSHPTNTPLLFMCLGPSRTSPPSSCQA